MIMIILISPEIVILMKLQLFDNYFLCNQTKGLVLGLTNLFVCGVILIMIKAN